MYKEGHLRNIATQTDAHFIITAGPGEEKTAQALSPLVGDISHYIYISNRWNVVFKQFIAMCDLLIRGSTGSFHIAGALDVPTAAFYPARKSATAFRWQTLNSSRTDFSPEKYIDENDKKFINPVEYGQEIVAFLRQVQA